MTIDITRKGYEFISSVLRYNSKKFNRIQGEARKIVFIERVIKDIINEYIKTNNPTYEISAEDSIDGIKTVIQLRREYILDTRRKAA